MGNNEFAPISTNNGRFVVLNISTQQKMLKIFNYPIPFGTTRDLLAIPGVGEADIRASLLKGEIRIKIEAGEIVVTQSDIDLLQFNTIQYSFLTNAGITNGTRVTPGQLSGVSSSGGSITYVWKQQIVPVGTKNGINRVFFTADLFLDGTYNGNIFRIIVNFNGRQLVKDVDYTISKTGTTPGVGFNTITFTSLIPDSSTQLYVDYTVATS